MKENNKLMGNKIKSVLSRIYFFQTHPMDGKNVTRNYALSFRFDRTLTQAGIATFFNLYIKLNILTQKRSFFENE